MSAGVMASALSPRDINILQHPQPRVAKRASDADAGKRKSLPAKAAMPKELRLEVKQLAGVLGSKTTEWTQRIAALKRVTAMARDEYGSLEDNGPAYLTGFVTLCPPLVIQLSELRSAIISEVPLTKILQTQLQIVLHGSVHV